jgi:hypothetical protein
MLEIPLEKTEEAALVIPVLRKIVPITSQYLEQAEAYYIQDSKYVEIMAFIRHFCITLERTPASYSTLGEEQLRDLILAMLNSHYVGRATGEAFRNNGKTDICVEQDNRAAFVAECKMWSGKQAMLDAIDQLDGYLTWRDCKTALILFVRNKTFFSVLETISETIKVHSSYKSCQAKAKNEFECTFTSKANAGQFITVRIIAFNLYSE